MMKKCPQCQSKSVRLYQNTTIEGKRRWVAIAWMCTDCRYVYTIAADTLVYRLGGDSYESSFDGYCPKCEKRLVNAYRHLNPGVGVQKWITIGKYCSRCKHIWLMADRC